MIALSAPLSYAAFLECSRCKKEYGFSQIQTYATCCNRPLLVRYEYMPGFFREDLHFRETNMWRYFEMLPVSDRKHIITLGEGMTPMLILENLGGKNGFADLLMKDESQNPTGSFKARGLSMAVSKAKEMGIKSCIVPTAGNAGGALAAYCAKGNLDAVVVMPRHTPDVFKQECKLYGAELILVDGLINDCARKVAEINQNGQYFDISTLKEPYRLEGKKTMGYEIAEQLKWQLPDVILYPAGGGTGLIAIWKAFREMMMMGWIDGPLPRMIAVQTDACDPLVRAYNHGENWQQGFVPKPSIANGLAVPFPFGMDLMLQVLEDSGGMAISVSEKEIIDAVKEIAKSEGLIISPEGAATWAALQQLKKRNLVDPFEKILLLNTGSGYKYLQNLEI
ncbi:MAG: threonine synthase [Chitinophagaceae bacterium]